MTKGQWNTHLKLNISILLEFSYGLLFSLNFLFYTLCFKPGSPSVLNAYFGVLCYHVCENKQLCSPTTPFPWTQVKRQLNIHFHLFRTSLVGTTLGSFTFFSEWCESNLITAWLQPQDSLYGNT